MQNSMYSSLFGALTCEHRLDIIANNLANASTTGFKREQMAFTDVFVKFAHDQIMEPVLSVRDKKLLPDPMHIAKVRIAESRTDFSQGSVRQSDNPLDFAIMGEGFFKVRTEQGEFYTRDGHFVVDTDGQLVTDQGYPVLSEGGEITLPQNTQIQVDGVGQIYANGEPVAQLQVVTVDDLNGLERYGQNLYRLRENSQAAETPAEEAQVAQGYLEMANVNVVDDMVNMIEVQRAFEAYQKMIQSTQETDEKVIGKVGTTLAG